MEADTRCVSRAAEDDGDLAGVEFFPIGETEDLLVVSGQLFEGHLELLGECHVGLDSIRPRALDSQAVTQRMTALLPTPLICQDPPRDAVEPETLLRSARDLTQSAPRGQEGFRDHVIGVGAAVGPSPRIAQHLIKVLLVEPVKAPPIF